MARRRFDSTTKTLFDRIQRQISSINGKLLNPKLPGATRDTLTKLRDELRSEARNIKMKYYQANENAVIDDSESLLKEARNYDVKQARKY